MTRKLFYLFALLTVILAACSKPAPRTSSSAVLPGTKNQLQLPDFSGLVQKEGPAIVNINSMHLITGSQISPGENLAPPFFGWSVVPRKFEAESLGSGFIISHDGFILTNWHVVADSSHVIVKLTDGRHFKAKVVGSDKETDLALLKIDAHHLPVVRIGDSNKLQPGQWVAAIGAPFGFDNSITVGIVSALGRMLPNDHYVPFIQTDAVVNPGNSGGPLFNVKGEVVGINSEIYSETGGYMGLSFAIPINIALNIARQIKVYGRVIRGHIGVMIQQVNDGIGKAFGLKTPQGVIISKVLPHSPAYRANLHVGDIVLKLNGHQINNIEDFPSMIAMTYPGDRVKLTLWRNGKEKHLKVRVGK